MNRIVPFAGPAPLPALIHAAGDRAGIRFLEFFASTIRNTHTRRAYARAAGDFRMMSTRLPARRRSVKSKFATQVYFATTTAINGGRRGQPKRFTRPSATELNFRS